jgi:hypothetical protein
MIDYLVHIYGIDTEPFRNLSALPDKEALQIMADLYVEGAVFWKRFKSPQGYWQHRQETEQWLRQGFIAKGGTPQETYPIYMVLGHPKWGDRRIDAATRATTREIEVPLSIFGERDVSFTYPDSMVSRMLEQEKNPAHYQPGYHGEVFTRSEIFAIIEEKGLPDEGWETNVPDHLAHYIEAQVWNRNLLLEYKKRLDADKPREDKK